MRDNAEAILSLSSRGPGQNSDPVAHSSNLHINSASLVASLSLNHYPISLASWDYLAYKPLTLKSLSQRLPPGETQPQKTYFFISKIIIWYVISTLYFIPPSEQPPQTARGYCRPAIVSLPSTELWLPSVFLLLGAQLVFVILTRGTATDKLLSTDQVFHL